MCGIVGYIGSRQATPILMNGLHRLEYRGYDSAGIALFEHGHIFRERAVGRIGRLEEKLKGQKMVGTVGMAHTRWATHGGVTEKNAHPHFACGQKLAIIHNGIIENYRELRTELGAKHVFSSETDSEVLAHLIESLYIPQKGLRQAVIDALKRVRGTYGLVVMHQDQPEMLVAARMGSPLVIGVGNNEYFIASDSTPILPYTKQVVFLEDGQIVQIESKNGPTIFNLQQELIQKPEDVRRNAETIPWDDAQAERQGYAHFMLKEIFDQPTVFQDAIRGRVEIDEGTAHLGGINMTEDEMRRVKRIVLLACGTASYAAMIGKYAFERLAGIPVEVDVGSEFRYRDPILDSDTLVFAISQSGETADTLAAVREAKRKGAKVRGIVNVVGSTIARETDGGTYIHAGPELAVASTKAYTNMVAILLLYALQFGRLKKVSVSTGQRIVRALLDIPEQMRAILGQADQIKILAEKYRGFRDFLYLGRGVLYPVALEGSHKLKEISYIHSEAYPAGEMKHGANALLSPDFPVFAIITKNQLYEKMRSNIEEVRARNSRVIVVATEGDNDIRHLADDVIFVPNTLELLQPLLATIPLQLFAYHMAVSLERDVDRPRNLAKSVTVE